MTDTVLDEAGGHDFFGHPAGLSTLFFTEMWERMSYYGMRALLVLFMTLSMQEGGLGITVASATAIYGVYTGAAYFMGLPGGWIADRLIGSQMAVWYGGIIIMSGHVLLAIPSDNTFFIGLILVVLGTGLLKPNIGAMVGQLYSLEDERRDAGYTLYYMGINLGSIIGYLVCGWLQLNAGYHWAFGAAAIGMGVGLIQFRLTLYKLDGQGSIPTQPLSTVAHRNSKIAILASMVMLCVVTILMLSGGISVNPVTLAQYIAITITAVFLAYYVGIYAFADLNIISNFEIPPAWFQSANSFFIIILAPFFAALWINIGKRWIHPYYGIKCAIGLIIMATGFIVMFFAAQVAASGLQAAPYWLIGTYFLHTVGELCLSPVALSAVSKLSPRRFAGQMMGVFTLTYSIGSVVAGLIAGNFDPSNIQQMPNLFLQISFFAIAAGIVVGLFSFKTKNWESLLENEIKS